MVGRLCCLGQLREMNGRVQGLKADGNESRNQKAGSSAFGPRNDRSKKSRSFCDLRGSELFWK
jgi:hypothetical protein